MILEILSFFELIKEKTILIFVNFGQFYMQRKTRVFMI